MTNDELTFSFHSILEFLTDGRTSNSSVFLEITNIPRYLDIELDIAVLDIWVLDKSDIGQKSLGHEKLDILVVLRL